jgi:cytidine deaminase
MFRKKTETRDAAANGALLDRIRLKPAMKHGTGARSAMTNCELIARAEAVVNPREVRGRLIGDVGAALVTDKGNVYVGVCIDTPSGTGFCAEHSAIAAMVTAGESDIDTIVAVRKDKDGSTVILPPCGRCRELIRQMSDRNLDTKVILSDGVVRLRELLPYHDWPE